MPTQAKTTKTAKSATATPFDAFNVQLPTVEVPAVFRDFAEKSAAQAQDNYAKIRTATEEAAEVVEGAYETAREGAVAIGVKALDIAKVNSEASLSFARDIFGAKTVADVIELQSTFARNQFGVFGAQAKEFQELAQKYLTDSAKPVAAQFEKAAANTDVA